MNNTPKLLVKYSEHPLLGIAFHKPGIGPIFKSCTESRVGSQRHAQSKLNYTNVMHNTAFGEIWLRCLWLRLDIIYIKMICRPNPT